MTTLLRLFILSASLLVSVPVAAMASPAADLIDPEPVFLDDADVPVDFERSNDFQDSTDNGTVISVRNYRNGDWLFQQSVFSAASDQAAGKAGNDYIQRLVLNQNATVRRIDTLGDQAAVGSGIDSTGLSYNVIVFRRGQLVCAVIRTHEDDVDLEADTLALAAKMDARASAAISS
jgi:hypothetical protein